MMRIPHAKSSTAKNTSQHPPAPAEVLLQTRSYLLHTGAWGTRSANLENDLTKGKSRAAFQRRENEARCGDVLSDCSGGESELIQRFAVHEQHLPGAFAHCVAVAVEANLGDCFDSLHGCHRFAMAGADVQGSHHGDR
jgi:hypothetical protein